MSPIHDQSYRRYTGERRALGRSWSVITSTGVRSLLSRKWFLAILVCAYIPFIVYAVLTYFATAYPQTSAFFAPNAKMIRDFFDWQDLFVFFVTVFAGSGLIAADRRANALQIYLSKPLMRLEYIAGKLGVVAVFLLFVTLVPALLLLLLQISFAGNFDFIRSNLFVMPAIVRGSLGRVFVFTFAMLALSSLSKSTRYVAILFAGVAFFTDAIFGVLVAITGSTRVAWISLGANIDVVSDAMFRQEPRYDAPVVVSALVLAGVIAVAVSVLERRVRGVEVVA